MLPLKRGTLRMPRVLGLREQGGHRMSQTYLKLLPLQNLGPGPDESDTQSSCYYFVFHTCTDNHYLQVPFLSVRHHHPSMPGGRPRDLRRG